MADFLSTGVSALLAFQKQLATTGHNISNVNTPGFSRQRVDLATRIPEFTGVGYIGSGVNAVSIQRMYDQFSIDQLRVNTSLNSRLDTYHGLASQVDNLLADPDAGLAPALQSFFDAAQGLADAPSSSPARQVLLSEADALAERFQSIDNRLAALEDAVNGQVTGLVEEINAYAESIAKVNKDIVLAVGSVGGQPPNDLLDKRDELIRQLAERVPVSTIEDVDGALNVFIGKGQTLVLRDQAQSLGISRSLYDPSKLEVTLGSTGTGPVVTDFLKGGAIGGALDFRKEILEPTRNALGRVALGLAQTFNEQHSLGLDLNNNLGAEFFSVTGLQNAPGTAINHSSNTPGATVNYYVDDVSKLTTSDYRLDFDGANYSLIRLSDNSLESFADPGAYPFTHVFADGLAIVVDSAPAADNSYLIQPTLQAARDISLSITNTNDIAAAAPLRSAISSSNLGDATISTPEIDDPSIAVNFTPVTIEVDAAGHYLVNGVDQGLFTSPQTVVVNNWKLEITGVPYPGDQFFVTKNDNASADNGNILKLAAAQLEPVIDGTTSLHNGYAQMVSTVGAKTHQLDINKSAQSKLLEQATQARESISGVNLDEEAANLVRFQQAYQAAAQSVAIAQSLFQTLLDAVRR